MKRHALVFEIVCIVVMLALIQLATAQATTSVGVIPSQNSVKIGETLTVNITVTDVQNLYGLDLELSWSISALKLVSVIPTLGTNNIPGGVLYGAEISEDLAPGNVYVNTSLSAANTYHLIATSVAPADSFNGSGTVATLIFNVTDVGNSQLTLSGELADHPEPGETTSEEIAATYSSGSVNAIIPEFSQIAIFGLVFGSATVTLVLSVKVKKRLQAGLV